MSPMPFKHREEFNDDEKAALTPDPPEVGHETYVSVRYAIAGAPPAHTDELRDWALEAIRLGEAEIMDVYDIAIEEVI